MLVPFIDTVFDKLAGNAVWGILSIGKHNPSLRIPFTLLVSNIICTYTTLSNKMARLATEYAAQWILCSRRLGVLAWFVIDFCGASTLRKLYAICSNSFDKSSALTYGDAS
jgi:hypothetical protein